MTGVDCEALRVEVERLRAMTGCTLGVGSGDGRLFVHGDHDSIMAARAYIFRAETAEAALLAKSAAYDALVADARKLQALADAYALAYGLHVMSDDTAEWIDNKAAELLEKRVRLLVSDDRPTERSDAT